MQTTQTADSRPDAAPRSAPASATPDSASQWENFHIIRRNGAVVGFEPSKIAIALTKAFLAVNGGQRSEEHTSELQSLMRISYAVFCLKKKKKKQMNPSQNNAMK